MEIKTGTVNVLSQLMTKMNADVDFVGGFVFGEPSVAVNSHDRSTHTFGYCHKAGRYFLEQGLKCFYESKCGKEHFCFVALLMIRKPLPSVVALQLFQKSHQRGLESGKGDGHGATQISVLGRSAIVVLERRYKS